MPQQLCDRVVLITGASAGIGCALARQLVGRGCRVVAAARSVDRLRSLADELGAEVLGIPTDIRDEASVRRLVEAAEAWTTLGIAWDRDIRSAEESADRIVSALEAALTEAERKDAS